MSQTNGTMSLEKGKNCGENMPRLDPLHVNGNIVKLITSFERDGGKRTVKTKDLGIQRMIDGSLFQEHILPLESNMINCSEWMLPTKIVMGSRCNKLIVYDVAESNFTYMEVFKKYFCSLSSNIYTIASNPSKTLLASNAPVPVDIMLYTLPDFQLLCMGMTAHDNSVLDIKWIDDETLISAASDGTIAIWSISHLLGQSLKHGSFMLNPIISKPCRLGDVIRSIHVESNRLTTLSSNCYVHQWDISRFKQISINKMPYFSDVAGLDYNKDHNIFAFGSLSHITFLDGRSCAIIKNINSKEDSGCCLSLRFQGDILSSSTEMGTVNFFDITASKYRDSSVLSSSPSHRFRTPILTHCYDESSTYLFTAGGSLGSDDTVGYAAIWK